MENVRSGDLPQTKVTAGDLPQTKVSSGDLPQLLGGLGPDGVYLLSPEIIKTLHNLRKIPTEIPNQVLPTGYELYESVPRLDKKAFRYLVKSGSQSSTNYPNSLTGSNTSNSLMFLIESVVRLGGLTADMVLTPLGEFIKGGDLTPNFTEIIKIQTAKKRQRERQLRENERIASRYVFAVEKFFKQDTDLQIKKTIANVNIEMEESKRFVRLGKPDFYQSQMEIIEKYGADIPGICKICDEYKNKIDENDSKWAAAKLKFPKKIENAAERTGLDAPETIGEINIKHRIEFAKYYTDQSPRIEQYLTSEDEIIIGENNPQPETFFVVDAKQDGGRALSNDNAVYSDITDNTTLQSGELDSEQADGPAVLITVDDIKPKSVVSKAAQITKTDGAYSGEKRL
jgi:hypothetical protein